MEVISQAPPGLSESQARRASALKSTLGPLATFLDDPRVVEVMLNADGVVWVDRIAARAARDGSAVLGARRGLPRPPAHDRAGRLLRARRVAARGWSLAMTGNREELAGRPRRGSTAYSPQEQEPSPRRTRDARVHAFPSLSSRQAAPRADRIVSSGDLPFAPRGHSPASVALVSRGPPPLSRLETYPPFGGSPFCFRGFPAEPGTPLRECRASLSRSSGGPALNETRAALERAAPILVDS
jgi:hypothetical protein